MMVEVTAVPKPPDDARRKFVASVIESCWFWSAVAALTVLDLTLFAWQSWGNTDDTTRDDLRTVELLISTLFVGELALRCYAHDREQLLCATNLFDSMIILSAFVLSLVEVYTPLLAMRAGRLIQLGAASTRCGRAARNTTRSAVEMRSFFDRAGKGLAARVAARASESDVAPLFIDVSKSRELAAVFQTRPWENRRQLREEGAVPLIEAPVLAAAASLKRLAKAEIENASAIDVAYRAKELQRKPHPKLVPVVPPTSGEDIEASSSHAASTQHKRVVTSARALLAIFEHALNQAREKGAPPPRLLSTLKGDLDLVFLNRDI